MIDAFSSVKLHFQLSITCLGLVTFLLRYLKQAVSFSKLVKPNKFFQFSFLDFLYLQNQSFPNTADK